VKGYLLDTSVILVAPEDPNALSEAVQAAVLDGPNYLSVISYWEVMLKCMKGNLAIADPTTWWHDVLGELAAVPLFLLPQHVKGVYGLPSIHKDPFDRILIAQAAAEALTFVTTDRDIPLYASQSFRVVV
jgi:PIN domain nuclease of toxin-antitoxin system